MIQKLLFAGMGIAIFAMIILSLSAGTPDPRPTTLFQSDTQLVTDNYPRVANPAATYDPLTDKIEINMKAGYDANGAIQLALHEIGHYFFNHRLTNDQKMDLSNKFGGWTAGSEAYAEMYRLAYNHSFDRSKIPQEYQSYFVGVHDIE